MRTGQAGIELIKSFEGFSSTPYLCPADVPTIGYGNTRRIDGSSVTMDDESISEEDGEALLAHELLSFERSVGKLITAELTQGMFDALVSFTYNLGSGNLQASTLRMKLNRGDYEDAAGEFPKWRKAGGRVLAGLVRRRAAEQALFVS
jgi:lysozyme